jgi:hypothetical protein
MESMGDLPVRIFPQAPSISRGVMLGFGLAIVIQRLDARLRDGRCIVSQIQCISIISAAAASGERGRMFVRFFRCT